MGIPAEHNKINPILNNSFYTVQNTITLTLTFFLSLHYIFYNDIITTEGF